MNDLGGFLLTLVAGTSVGFSLWPLKWARAWKWENFWLLYSVFSLIVVPFALAFALLPHLSAVYAALTLHELLRPFLLGTLWGFAQLGCGICVHRLGLAVTGAVVNGIGAAVGTIVPLIALHREMTFAASGLLILIGTGMMLAGASLCGWSGYLREDEIRLRNAGSGFRQEEAAMRQTSVASSAYLLTLGLAVGSGILAAALNIALAYGSDIMQLAQSRGAQASWAPFAVWPVALLGGSIVNIAYSVYLLSRNRTWKTFKIFSFKELMNPVVAACLWMGGIALYSSGTTFLGSLGVSIGYAVFMITMVLSGQIAGLATGEWRFLQPKVYRVLGFGVACLVAAILTIGTSRYLAR